MYLQNVIQPKQPTGTKRNKNIKQKNIEILEYEEFFLFILSYCSVQGNLQTTSSHCKSAKCNESYLTVGLPQEQVTTKTHFNQHII